MVIAVTKLSVSLCVFVRRFSSAWTYYGIWFAANSGLNYLPIYIGPNYHYSGGLLFFGRLFGFQNQ
jgi:hypothetical protein